MEDLLCQTLSRAAFVASCSRPRTHRRWNCRWLLGEAFWHLLFWRIRGVFCFGHSCLSDSLSTVQRWRNVAQGGRRGRRWAILPRLPRMQNLMEVQESSEFRIVKGLGSGQLWSFISETEHPHSRSARKARRKTSIR